MLTNAFGDSISTDLEQFQCIIFALHQFLDRSVDTLVNQFEYLDGRRQDGCFDNTNDERFVVNTSLEE